MFIWTIERDPKEEIGKETLIEESELSVCQAGKRGEPRIGRRSRIYWELHRLFWDK